MTIMRMRSQSVLVGMVLWEEVRRKRSQALIPSSCGILVYNDEVSVSVSVSVYLFCPGGRERLYCFPLFAHGQLITTSVTSHSNRSKLSLAWLV